MQKLWALVANFVISENYSPHLYQHICWGWRWGVGSVCVCVCGGGGYWIHPLAFCQFLERMTIFVFVPLVCSKWSTILPFRVESYFTRVTQISLTDLPPTPLQEYWFPLKIKFTCLIKFQDYFLFFFLMKLNSSFKLWLTNRFYGKWKYFLNVT